MGVTIKGAPLAEPLKMSYADIFEAPPAHVTTHSTKSVGVKGGGKKVLLDSMDQQPLGNPLIHPSRLARVTVSASRTVNLGDFNSANFRVEVSLPCDMDEVGVTYKSALDFATDRLDEVMKLGGH